MGLMNNVLDLTKIEAGKVQLSTNDGVTATAAAVLPGPRADPDRGRGAHDEPRRAAGGRWCIIGRGMAAGAGGG
jgi:hypothetical protein